MSFRYIVTPVWYNQDRPNASMTNF